jgi:hypothetical protein
VPLPCLITAPPFEQIILDAVEQVGGIYLVTADHGNAEDMVKRNKSGKPLLDKSGDIQILTSHTLQPVSSVPYDPRPMIGSLRKPHEVHVDCLDFNASIKLAGPSCHWRPWSAPRSEIPD